MGVLRLQEGKKGKTTVQIIRELAEPIAVDLGLSLWDIRFVKEGSQWYLRVFIDKEGGVSINDCESMSRALDKPLDELDPINQSYCLEVCSPGIERELVEDEHFNKYIGKDVNVKLIRANEMGEREFTGQLAGASNNEIALKKNDGVLTFNRKNVAYVRVVDNEINFNE